MEGLLLLLKDGIYGNLRSCCSALEIEGKQYEASGATTSITSPVTAFRCCRKKNDESTRSADSAVEKGEDVQMVSPSNEKGGETADSSSCCPSCLFYIIYILSCLNDDTLVEVKFLWKRIEQQCKDINTTTTSSSPLTPSMLVLKMMLTRLHEAFVVRWKNDRQKFFDIMTTTAHDISSPTYRSTTSSSTSIIDIIIPLWKAVIQRYKIQTLQYIEKNYISIKEDAVLKLLPTTQQTEETVESIARRRGWSKVMKGDMTYYSLPPPPSTTHIEGNDCGAQLRVLSGLMETLSTAQTLSIPPETKPQQQA